jgi:predicted kinase
MSVCKLVIDDMHLPLLMGKMEFFVIKAIENNTELMTMFQNKDSQLFSRLYGAAYEELLKKAEMYRQGIEANRAAIEPEPGEDVDLSERARIIEDNAAYQSYIDHDQAILSNLEDLIESYFPLFETYIKQTDLFGKVKVDDREVEDDSIRMSFEQTASDLNNLDDVSTLIQFLVRGLQKAVFQKEFAGTDEAFMYAEDEYGTTVNVDYAMFMRKMLNDLEGLKTSEDMMDKLKQLAISDFGYKMLLERIDAVAVTDSLKFDLLVALMQTASKAILPVYTVSTDGPTWTVYENSTGKEIQLTMLARENFARHGIIFKGEQLASQDENGRFYLDANSPFAQKKKIALSTIQDQIDFLAALGFPLAESTRKAILKSPELIGILPNSTNRNYSALSHILYSIDQRIQSGYTLFDPFVELQKSVRGGITQNQIINHVVKDINLVLTAETRYSDKYSAIRVVKNANQDAINTQQLYNNYTLIATAINQVDKYPTLQDLLEGEPALFYLDPRTTPSARNSVFLNTMFEMDPDSSTFGRRKRDRSTNLPVKLEVVNFNSLKVRSDENDKATDLNPIDKIAMDFNGFFRKGLKETPRPGDKSTVVAMKVSSYGHTDLDLQKQDYPLSLENRNDRKPFLNIMYGYFEDVMMHKYLHQRGFYAKWKNSDKHLENGFGMYDSILSFNPAIGDQLKAEIMAQLAAAQNQEQARDIIQAFWNKYETALGTLIENFFTQRAQKMLRIVELNRNPRIQYKDLFNTAHIRNELDSHFFDMEDPLEREAAMTFYLKNAFILNTEVFKLVHGDTFYFVDTHKRLSKDTATGHFTFMDEGLMGMLNNYDASGSKNSYGAYTNYGQILYWAELFERGDIDEETYERKIEESKIKPTFRSAVIQEVKFKSVYHQKMKDEIEALRENGQLSDEEYRVYKASLEAQIDNSYGDKGNKEADGQGVATLDFYRTMSLLTNTWSPKQEETYKKITEWNSLERKLKSRASYTDDSMTTLNADGQAALRLRDQIQFSREEMGYFPLRKFQYAGPTRHEQSVNGETVAVAVPIFDKFSLRPLLPSVFGVGDPTDQYLWERMMHHNISYVKFESATKVESPKVTDTLYLNFDAENPSVRNPVSVNYAGGFEVENGGFVTTHELFFDRFKEQVSIEEDPHGSVIFGSQARKLFMMNLLGVDESNPLYENLITQYRGLLDDLITLRRNEIIQNMGGRYDQATQTYSIVNPDTFAAFVRTEFEKKGADSTIMAALKLNDRGELVYGLDAVNQSKAIEKLILSIMNRQMVRYKMNGSMLTQMASTGTERVGGFNRKATEAAYEKYGTNGLRFYGLEKKANGRFTVRSAEVKISMNKNFSPLLNLEDPERPGVAVGTVERLNELLRAESAEALAFQQATESARRMIAYRIPTAGRNFLDHFVIKEFLPEEAGDVIILPSEIVIKSGSDYDIDKMFAFYPNLDYSGERIDTDYTSSDIYSVLAELQTLKDTRAEINESIEALKTDSVYQTALSEGSRLETLLAEYRNSRKLLYAQAEKLKSEGRVRSAAYEDLVEQIKLLDGRISATDESRRNYLETKYLKERGLSRRRSIRDIREQRFTNDKYDIYFEDETVTGSNSVAPTVKWNRVIFDVRKNQRLEPFTADGKKNGVYTRALNAYIAQYDFTYHNLIDDFYIPYALERSNNPAQLAYLIRKHEKNQDYAEVIEKAKARFESVTGFEPTANTLKIAAAQYPIAVENDKLVFTQNDSYYERKSKIRAKERYLKQLEQKAQNRLLDVVHETLALGENFLQTVTPSSDFHIDPIVDDLFQRLGILKPGEKRGKKHYNNTEALMEQENLEKMISLMRAKENLGIAAVYNAFNILLQDSQAMSNPEFLRKNKIGSFFTLDNPSKGLRYEKEAGYYVTEIAYGGLYDEKGVFKSEFYTEFINAFVDAANNDYAFAINLVKEFAPIAFYMKAQGLSSEKILYFINQPVMRTYVKHLRKHTALVNKTLAPVYLPRNHRPGLGDEESTPIVHLVLSESERQQNDYYREGDENRKYKMTDSARDLAIRDTLAEMNQYGEYLEFDWTKSISRGEFFNRLKGFGLLPLDLKNPRYNEKTKQWEYPELSPKSAASIKQLQQVFKEETLREGVLAETNGEPVLLSTLTAKMQNRQLLYLLEFMNQKKGSDNMTEIQQTMNFDTKTMASGYDVNARIQRYKDLRNNAVLSADTIEYLWSKSITSPLNNNEFVNALLEKIFPLMNHPTLNDELRFHLDSVVSEKLVFGDDQKERFARIFKADFAGYVLQNYVEKSPAAMAMFKSYYQTELGFNEYLKSLIENGTLMKQHREIQNDPQFYELAETFPILNQIFMDGGLTNTALFNFAIPNFSNNELEKKSLALQFYRLTELADNDLNPYHAKVRQYMRNLGLYDIFQSGKNYSTYTYIDMVPSDLINVLYDEAFRALQSEMAASPDQNVLENAVSDFARMFFKNNQNYLLKEEQYIAGSPVKDENKRGKWYHDSALFAGVQIQLPAYQMRRKRLAREELAMGSKNRRAIVEGVKTLTMRNYRLNAGMLYELQADPSDTNRAVVDLEYMGPIRYSDLQAMTPEQQDMYATQEGFGYEVLKPQLVGDLVIPVGISGSGQEVWIEQIRRATPNVKIQVVSLEAIAKKIDISDPVQKATEMIQLVNNAVSNALTVGEKVIVDATNLNEAYRDAIVKAVQAEFPQKKISYKLFEANPSKSRHRMQQAQKRTGVKPVSDAVLAQQLNLYQKFEARFKAEKWQDEDQLNQELRTQQQVGKPRPYEVMIEAIMKGETKSIKKIDFIDNNEPMHLYAVKLLRTGEYAYGKRFVLPSRLEYNGQTRENQFVSKDQKKANVATHLISFAPAPGEGERISASFGYAQAAKGQGVPVNTMAYGESQIPYDQDTVAMVTIRGKGAATEVEKKATEIEMLNVLLAGGTIVQDDKEGRQTDWNKTGEFEVMRAVVDRLARAYSMPTGEFFSKGLEYSEHQQNKDGKGGYAQYRLKLEVLFVLSMKSSSILNSDTLIARRQISNFMKDKKNKSWLEAKAKSLNLTAEQYLGKVESELGDLRTFLDVKAYEQKLLC